MVILLRYCLQSNHILAKMFMSHTISMNEVLTVFLLMVSDTLHSLGTMIYFNNRGLHFLHDNILTLCHHPVKTKLSFLWVPSGVPRPLNGNWNRTQKTRENSIHSVWPPFQYCSSFKDQLDTLHFISKRRYNGIIAVIFRF